MENESFVLLLSSSTRAAVELKCEVACCIVPYITPLDTTGGTWIFVGSVRSSDLRNSPNGWRLAGTVAWCDLASNRAVLGARARVASRAQPMAQTCFQPNEHRDGWVVWTQVAPYFHRCSHQTLDKLLLGSQMLRSSTS